MRRVNMIDSGARQHIDGAAEGLIWIEGIDAVTGSDVDADHALGRSLGLCDRGYRCQYKAGHPELRIHGLQSLHFQAFRGAKQSSP